jgi:DNA-binding response OmpR family regulator
VTPEAQLPLVLVADDDPDLLAMIAHLLKRSHYRVVTAEDGEQALDLAFERLPDLAVLDVRMPKLDGVEVLRKIRENSRTSGTPAILISAGVDQERIAACLAAGADEFVKKPFSPRELVAVVETVLSPN